MEYSDNGFLEELLALRNDHWTTTTTTTSNLPSEINGFYNSNTHLNWNSFDSCLENCCNPLPISSNLQEIEIPLPIDQTLNCCSLFGEFFSPFGDDLSAPEITDKSSNTVLDTPPFRAQEGCGFPVVVMEGEEQQVMMEGILGNSGGGVVVQCLEGENQKNPCKEEPVIQSGVVEVGSDFNMGLVERKNKVKKLDGQPSKNLMAERRRRKRLNDRLSMLRSIVPKISKMDRTSILGDTIDYMKELLERINNLQEENDKGVGSNQFNLMSIFKDVKPNEVLVRNSPKFDVERREIDTRIEICCSGKPGLLLSTVSALEALGLEIQQCVISCFNDFSMQASCSEELEQRGVLGSEDIKQALFRNAGYGGRCL